MPSVMKNDSINDQAFPFHHNRYSHLGIIIISNVIQYKLFSIYDKHLTPVVPIFHLLKLTCSLCNSSITSRILLLLIIDIVLTAYSSVGIKSTSISLAINDKVESTN